jgi:NAD(P)-dependent dehydrogenase (short-subunit alcohol dehydrogenase family)
MADKCALVTGGSSGIGAAICKALLAVDYQVVSLDRTAAEIASPRFNDVRVDLSDARATREVALDVARRFPVTTVIHNAGATRERALEDVAVDDLQALTNLHLTASLLLVQANLPTMKSERFGRIVLVSSRAVLGLAGRTVYSATKAGMLGMARTWALELGMHGITVNVVAPGPIQATGVFHEIIPKDSPKLPRIVESIPVKRLGMPEDVARAVVFFAAPEAGFVTGQTLFVCGGTSVGSIVY